MLYRQMEREEVNPITLENQRVREDLISKFDVDDVDLSALMFQSGYLTIVKEELTEDDDMYFTLDYPNLEVRRSFTRGLLDRMGLDQSSVADDSRALLELLVANNFNRFGKTLHKFIAGIPHQWYVNNRIKNYEAHYASMLYLALKVSRADLIAEDSSNHGRADMVISEGRQVFVIEFKMVDNKAGAESAIEDAMTQMKERGYAAKYWHRNEPIHLVAMIFGRKERNVIAIQAEHNGVAQTFSFD